MTEEADGQGQPLPSRVHPFTGPQIRAVIENVTAPRPTDTRELSSER